MTRHARAAAASAPISMLTSPNSVEFSYGTLEEAFPALDPGIEPYGDRIVVQVRHPKKRTAGGLELVTETRSTEYYNTQVAKVISLGPLCFKSVKTVPSQVAGMPDSEELVPWPEGPWFKIGDYVRIPKHGGDRFTVETLIDSEIFDPGPGHMVPTKERDEIVFCVFRARDILGRITGDPLKIKAFLD